MSLIINFLFFFIVFLLNLFRLKSSPIVYKPLLFCQKYFSDLVSESLFHWGGNHRSYSITYKNSFTFKDNRSQKYLKRQPTINRKNNNFKIEKPNVENVLSLFNSSDELQYDRFAACLTASEGLRRIRDVIRPETRIGIVNEDKKRISNYLLQVLTSNRFHFDINDNVTTEEYKGVCAQYILNINKVIKSLGLNVNQFKEIEKILIKNPFLEKRVIAQAYIYRLAAMTQLKSRIYPDAHVWKEYNNSHRRSPVEKFAHSISDIERFRTVQMERLKKTMNIRYLPKKLHYVIMTFFQLLIPRYELCAKVTLSKQRR